MVRSNLTTEDTEIIEVTEASLVGGKLPSAFKVAICRGDTCVAHCYSFVLV